MTEPDTSPKTLDDMEEEAATWHRIAVRSCRLAVFMSIASLLVNAMDLPVPFDKVLIIPLLIAAAFGAGCSGWFYAWARQSSKAVEVFKGGQKQP